MADIRLILLMDTVFVFPEATSITVAPEDTEVKVGDEVVLRCAASYDPMLDITFVWAIDYRVIDFDLEKQHYERVMVKFSVSMTSTTTDTLFVALFSSYITFCLLLVRLKMELVTFE